MARLIDRPTADRVGRCWGYGSGHRGDPGPWEGEIRNMWKPTAQPGLWFMGGNLAQARMYSHYLSLQLQYRYHESEDRLLHPSRTGPRTGTAGGISAHRVNPGAFNGHETTVAVVMRSDPKDHMGTDRPLIALDEDAPHQPVKLKFFKICTTAVTNAQYAEFVEATDYRTEAELLGNSFVFSGFLPDATDTGNEVVADDRRRPLAQARRAG